MRILRAADRIATPWKNGGGMTREVAVWPPGAGMDDFDWRVSLADVAADGPFSAFMGVDRVLTVVEGQGLVLDLEGQATPLDVLSPFAFPGEATVAARLTAGPIRDLNVMVRRGVWTAGVEPWRDEPVMAADGPTLVVLLAATEDLAAYDVIWFDAGETAALDFPLETRALIVALRAVRSTIG
jgi:environmental stress-induced protein Ves